MQQVHPKPLSADYAAVQNQRIADLQRTLAPLLEGRSRVTLEIGSGHGHFLTAYGEAHPDRFCIGIDIVLDRLERSERKLHRARLANVAFVRASAEDFLAALPGNVLLDDVFILFPDPWPKRRHHKKRLIQPSFLTTLAAKSTPSARLFFRTDHTDYFVSALAVVRQHPSWTVDPTAAWPFEKVTVFQARAPSYQSLVARRSLQ